MSLTADVSYATEAVISGIMWTIRLYKTNVQM